MKVYKKENVFEAALDRIRWLFDEFDEVIVSSSGGKDSTVVFNLALQVAEEKDRLPLKVMFIDQEAEWRHTIEYMTRIMYDQRVTPFWYQMPIRIFNATSATDHWLNCWEKEAEDKWIHPRQPIAITENVYGTERFNELFPAIAKVEYPNKRVCYLAGMRADENPKRFVAMTQSLTYKWATWGKVLNKANEHYTMYPIYDWTSSDVWKAIVSNDWDFNKVYEQMYGHGVQLEKMRVSNLHHETAVESLFNLQEIEGDTWNRMTNRLAGIDTAGKMGAEDFYMRDLPFVFKDWKEYRDYLLEHLILDSEDKSVFTEAFKLHDLAYEGTIGENLYRMHVSAILAQDVYLTKLANFDMSVGFRQRGALKSMNPDYPYLYLSLKPKKDKRSD
jgi:predicted phosphoadenosine phosphosulfate sulfurtransferase